MPIYEYECLSCKQQFEKLVRLDAPLPVCPECGGADVQKKISMTSFLLNGDGWYKDHYGLKTNPTKAEGAPSSGAAAASPTSSGTTSSSGAGGSSSGTGGGGTSTPTSG